MTKNRMEELKKEFKELFVHAIGAIGITAIKEILRIKPDVDPSDIWQWFEKVLEEEITGEYKRGVNDAVKVMEMINPGSDFDSALNNLISKIDKLLTKPNDQETNTTSK